MALAQQARDAGAEIAAQDVVADDRAQIERWLRAQVQQGVDLIFTTGGTGFTDDDVTPEASKAVIERDAPGFAEAMRAESVRPTPAWGSSPAGCRGIAGRTLIINFPGNPKAIDELFGVIAPWFGHAVDTLQRRAGAPTPGHRARPRI